MSNLQSIKVMIMAGGTGGHVFPALAVAKVLQQRNAEVIWLGTRRGIETELVPNAGIKLHFIRVEGVRGRGLTGLLKAPFLIAYALAQAISIVRREQPDVVLGFGGFASGPGGLAARLLRKPLVIHEQNAVAGTTNRLLAHCATRILCAFRGAFARAEMVGNPVRDTIAALPIPRARYNDRQEQKKPLRLLVLGGSLGAKAINELLPVALMELPKDARPEVWHQTGKHHDQATLALYMECQVDAKVEAFIADMAAAYGWADLVVCRAGALTVSELMVAGVAALLVPLPSAIDDHQTHNAATLSDVGAGISIAQRDLSAAKLASLFLTSLNERAHLAAMADKARAFALPDAATRVADICMEVARG